MPVKAIDRNGRPRHVCPGCGARFDAKGDGEHLDWCGYQGRNALALPNLNFPFPEPPWPLKETP